MQIDSIIHTDVLIIGGGGAALRAAEMRTQRSYG